MYFRKFFCNFSPDEYNGINIHVQVEIKIEIKMVVLVH